MRLQVELPEFERYVASMTTWMRTELMADLNIRSIFEHLASRAAETTFAPTDVPPPVDIGDGRGAVSSLEVVSCGVRLEIPDGALSGVYEPWRHPQRHANGSTAILTQDCDGGDGGSSPITSREGETMAGSRHGRLAVQTLAPDTVRYLAEGDEQQAKMRSAFAFSPVVRVRMQGGGL